MNGSASSLIAQPPLPWRRIAWALAASLLLHWIVADFGFDGRSQPALTFPVLRAELMAMPPVAESSTEGIVAMQPVAPAAAAAPLPESSPSQPVERGSTTSEQVQTPGFADQRIYLARELDRYPQPLAPLPLRRPPGSGSLRLWLTIDAHGQVVELSPSSSGQPIEPPLREQLLAVIFSPALRDQQAVKSRILLEFND